MMASTASERNHTKFLGHLDASHPAVNRIHKWLQGRGHKVIRGDTDARAGEHKDWKDNTDGGDLFVEQRFEVKGLGAVFTNRKDWPYKDKYIVCAKHSFDLSTPKPFCYIHVNKAMTHIGVVMSADCAMWYVEVVKDSRYENVEQESYFSPLHLVAFAPLGPS